MTTNLSDLVYVISLTTTKIDACEYRWNSIRDDSVMKPQHIAREDYTDDLQYRFWLISALIAYQYSTIYSHLDEIHILEVYNSTDQLNSS